MDSASVKHCGGCNKTRPFSDFSASKLHSTGRTIHCKECHRKYHQERMANDPSYRARKNANKARWYKNNVERTKLWAAKHAEWKRNNPEKQLVYLYKRKAAKSGSVISFTEEDILARFRWQKGKCAICRISITDKYHIDHITPLSKGGSNEAKNIQLLCPTCNLRKNCKDPIDYMQSLGCLL